VKPAIAVATQDGSSASPATTTATTLTKTPQKHAVKRVSGTPTDSGKIARVVKKIAGVVESILPAKGDGRFVVRAGKRDYRFILAPTAKLRDSRGEKIGLSNLKKGVKVVVSYRITAKGDEAVGIKAVI
jgi:hypothetical protein